MKEYLDSIGRAIPRVLEVAAEYEMSGNPDALQLYGYYEWRGPWWPKILLGVRNGAELQHQHQGQGSRGGG